MSVAQPLPIGFLLSSLETSALGFAKITWWMSLGVSQYPLISNAHICVWNSLLNMRKLWRHGGARRSGSSHKQRFIGETLVYERAVSEI